MYTEIVVVPDAVEVHCTRTEILYKQWQTQSSVNHSLTNSTVILAVENTAEPIVQRY